MKVSLTLGRYMAIRYGVLFALTTLAFLSIDLCWRLARVGA